MNATIFFKALADPTRLRALMLVAQSDELCVCELTHALGTSQPKVSRHLAQLREANVLQDRRAGLWIYYSLHPDLPEWARAVLTQTAAGLAGTAPYAADRRALDAMPNRPAGRCAA